jgi:hypothetical protein
MDEAASGTREIPDLALIFIGGTREVATMLGVMRPYDASVTTFMVAGRVVTQDLLAQQMYDTLLEIIEGYLSLLWNEFIYCQFASELDGSNLRYSFMQVFVVLLLIVFAISLLFAAVPSVFYFAMSFFSAVGNVVGPIVGFLLGVALWVVIILFLIGIPTGYKALCFPTLPPIVFTSQAMQFLSLSLFPKCLIYGNGLIEQLTYTSETCAACGPWENGTWTFANCQSDLNWHVQDVITFALYAYWPSAYTFIQSPGNFFWPLNVIISSAAAQAYLHKWDGLDLSSTADPFIYSAEFTCFWGVELLPSIILLELLGLLLAYGPILQLLKLLLGVAAVLLGAIFWFLIAFFATLFFILDAPRKLALNLDKLDEELRRIKQRKAEKQALAGLMQSQPALATALRGLLRL